VNAITDAASKTPYTIINAASAKKTNASSTTPRGRSTASEVSTIDRMTMIPTEETHEFSWQPLPPSKQLLKDECADLGRIQISFVPRRLEDGNKKTQVLILTCISDHSYAHRTQACRTQDRQRKTFHRTPSHAFSIRKHYT
jgi:hypothetical protein